MWVVGGGLVGAEHAAKAKTSPTTSIAAPGPHSYQQDKAVCLLVAHVHRD